MPHAIWTAAIGADAELIAVNPPMPRYVTPDADIIVEHLSSPARAGYTNAGMWEGSGRCDETDLIPDLEIHIPDDFVLEGDTSLNNHSAAIKLNEDGDYFESQPMTRCAEESDVTFGEGCEQFYYNINDADAGIEGSHGGSRMSALFGTWRVSEINGGYGGNHALKVVVPPSWLSSENDGYRWPATTADTGFESAYTGSVPACRMGSLLCLAQDFDYGAVQTQRGSALANALRDYGAYIVDIRVDDPEVFAIIVEHGPPVSIPGGGPDGTGEDAFIANMGGELEADLTDDDPFAEDMQLIIAALMVVNNNVEGNEGGGGGAPGGGDDDETTFGSYRLGDWTPTPDEYPDFQSEYDRGVHPKKARFQPIGYKGEISQWLGEAGKKYRYHQFVREDRAAELEAYLASLEGAEFNIVGARPDLSVMVTLDNADITWTGRTPGDVFLTPVIHPSLDLDYAYWWEVTIDMTGTGSAAPVWTNPAPLPD